MRWSVSPVLTDDSRCVDNTPLGLDPGHGCWASDVRCGPTCLVVWDIFESYQRSFGKVWLKMWLSSDLEFCPVILLRCSTFRLQQVTKYWSVFFVLFSWWF